LLNVYVLYVPIVPVLDKITRLTCRSVGLAGVLAKIYLLYIKMAKTDQNLRIFRGKCYFKLGTTLERTMKSLPKTLPPP